MSQVCVVSLVICIGGSLLLIPHKHSIRLTLIQIKKAVIMAGMYCSSRKELWSYVNSITRLCDRILSLGYNVSSKHSGVNNRIINVHHCFLLSNSSTGTSFACLLTLYLCIMNVLSLMKTFANQYTSVSLLFKSKVKDVCCLLSFPLFLLSKKE